VQTVFDLRTAAERTDAPDRLPADERAVDLDVLADSAHAAAASMTTLLTDPETTERLLGDGRSVTMMIESYRNIVDLPSALASYRAFFLDLADPERSGAALFHCTTGKDRTGWAAASLLTLLGADTDTVYADYLQTNVDLTPALEPVFDRADQAGIRRDTLAPVLGVRAEYLDTAFAQATSTYGSMRDYLRTGLQISDEMEEALRTRFVAAG
jgi:protein-tyrosine phosphatase